MQISEILINKIMNEFPDEKFTSLNNWSKLTTLGVGTGKCIVTEPTSREILAKILYFTHEHNIKVLPLGAGSNTIGTDIDNTKLIIKLTNENFKQVSFVNNFIKAGAGKYLISLVKECAEYNLGGIAELAGIPGTLGGSLNTNAGRLGVSIFDFIEKLEGYRLDGSKWECSADNIKWGYRFSELPIDVIVTDIVFKLKHEEKNVILHKTESFLKSRNSIYPKARNAGCIFKNPASGHGAGKLIDKAGCKNLETGSLKVSHQHANFIINTENISSEKDFLILAEQVRNNVFNFSGIYLYPEVFFADNSSYLKLINIPSPLKVAVLKGGICRERQVSLESAANVSNALKEAGYIVKEFDIKTPALPWEARDCDVVFPVLHGGFGEDGRIQKDMEKIRIPFVGCGSKASETAIDKVKNKQLFHKLGIITPKSIVIDENETEFPKSMKLPVVVKPPMEGSTFGITIVHKPKEWLPALKKAAIDPTKKILIEEYIDNFELTAGVFNGKALPIVHISYPGELYDYDAKYTHNEGETLYISPPDENIIPIQIQKEIQQKAVEVYNKLGAKHLLRVDVLLDKKTFTPYFLEINNLPGFTSSSLFPKAANAVDIPYIQVCAILVKTAYDDSKHNEK